MRYCILFFFFISVLRGGAQPLDEITPIDGVIAVVGDEVVLESDIALMRTQMRESGQSLANVQDCDLLEDLLYEKLLLNQSKIDSIEVTDEQVNSELEKRLAVFIRQIGSEEALEKYYEKSMAQIREDFREVLRNQLLVQSMQREITGNSRITPAEVREFFEAIPKDSLPLIDAVVEVAQITRFPNISLEEKQRLRDRLNDFRKQVVEEGKDFATLAVLYSEDPGSARKGGELGMQPRGTFVPEFDAVGFTLRDGEVSSVFETEYGFHIMQMIERRGEQYNARHILLKPRVEASQMEKAASYLDSLRNLILLDSLQFGQAARMYSGDEQTRNQNGLIVNRDGSTDIPMDELDPQIFMAIDTLESSEISRPAYFTTRDGRQGYRLIQLLKRTSPHRANLDQDYQFIQMQAEEGIRNKKVDVWVSEKVSSTYVFLAEHWQGCDFNYNWLGKNKPGEIK